MTTRAEITKNAIGIALATAAYGISYGAIAVNSGLSVWQACASSLLIFTGASQFALIGVLGAGGGTLAAAGAGLLLGTRNTLYGLSIAPLLKLFGWKRAAAAQLLIDESTAMALNHPEPATARFSFLSTGAYIYLGWNLATLVGATFGNAFGDPKQFGLDAAVAAAFLALLWPRLTNATSRLVAALGAFLALILVPLVPAGIPVLAAASIAICLGWRE